MISTGAGSSNPWFKAHNAAPCKTSTPPTMTVLRPIAGMYRGEENKARADMMQTGPANPGRAKDGTLPVIAQRRIAAADNQNVNHSISS
jgi:hypothetical protein